MVLEQQGADEFFGEPALNLDDLMRVSGDGKGYISVLSADKLMNNPRLYATYLLWMLSELFEQLPEEGDLEKPKLRPHIDAIRANLANALGIDIDRVSVKAKTGEAVDIPAKRVAYFKPGKELKELINES